MKRFSAPNTDIIKGFGVDDVSAEGFSGDGGFGNVVLDSGLLMTWRFRKVVIAWCLWRASGAGMRYEVATMPVDTACS